MDKSDKQFKHKIFIGGSGKLISKSDMLKDLGIEVVNEEWSDYAEWVNQINDCTIMVVDRLRYFEAGYMYARLQVYVTFTNLPKERKPQLVVIGEESKLADITNLPTWEAFLRWLKK